MALVDSVLEGDRLALARLLTHVENNTEEGRGALDALYPLTGRAHLIGVTGAPGTGKSTLVNRLALHFRGKGKRVAITAVDPSSPFSGGALLGDRVRMKDLSGDTNVFIRSMASRGALGGLARSTAGVVRVFDAAGYEIIIIETVGAGQAEVDIARLAHTTLVIEAPDMGDDIQAIKAGILEVADILVVNKADRPGAENTEKALRSVVEFGHSGQHIEVHHGQLQEPVFPDELQAEAWAIPILKTVSTDGRGISALAEEIERHAEYLRAGGGWTVRERARLEAETQTILQQALLTEFHLRVPQRQYDEILDRVFVKALSPGQAVRLLTEGASTPSMHAQGAIQPEGPNPQHGRPDE